MFAEICPNTNKPCPRLQVLGDLAVALDPAQQHRAGEIREFVAGHGCIGGCVLEHMDAAAFLQGDESAARAKRFIEGFAEFSDPLLTAEEKDALFFQEDRGITPAPMRQFEDLDAFKEGSNNFFLAFNQSPDGFLNQRTRAIQRFKAIHPDKMEELLSSIDPLSLRKDIDDEGWQKLYEAYQEVSQLVDVDDPSVVKEGEIDDYFLCR